LADVQHFQKAIFSRAWQRAGTKVEPPFAPLRQHSCKDFREIFSYQA
jgi:hypothetical protein